MKINTNFNSKFFLLKIINKTKINSIIKSKNSIENQSKNNKK